MSASLVETNMYRCTKPCSNCPFIDNGKKIHLRDGRVDGIKENLFESDSHCFPCHKTLHNLDEEMNYTEPQKTKMCYGAYMYLRKKSQPNLKMRLAYSMGIDNPPRTHNKH